MLLIITASSDTVEFKHLDDNEKKPTITIVHPGKSVIQGFFLPKSDKSSGKFT